MMPKRSTSGKELIARQLADLAGPRPLTIPANPPIGASARWSPTLKRPISRAATSEPRVEIPAKAATDHAIKLCEDQTSVAADGKVV
jgi:hypothetical protein